jgi:translation initiation factor IF-1
MNEARHATEQTTNATAVVVACLPNGQLRVRTGSGAVLTAHVGGDLRRAMPNLVPGDEVRIEAAPFDPGRARVVSRATVPAEELQSPKAHSNKRDPS